jgi:MFS family permease
MIRRAWSDALCQRSRFRRAPLSGWILELDGVWGLAGWQWLFICEGVPTVLLGLVVMFYLTDGPEKAHWLAAVTMRVSRIFPAGSSEAAGRRRQHLERAAKAPVRQVLQTLTNWLSARAGGR